MNDEIFKKIVETLGKEIIYSEKRYSETTRELEKKDEQFYELERGWREWYAKHNVLEVNNEHLKKTNEELYKKIEVLENRVKELEIVPVYYDAFLDDAPREYYDKLDRIPYSPISKNWSVFRDGDEYIAYGTYYDETVSGIKYVREEDAREFCKKFNKRGDK